MTVFHDTYWLDGRYKVTLRPYECARRLVKYHSSYLPYMDEQQTALRLSITPSKRVVVQERVSCAWVIKKDGSEERHGEGNEVVQMLLRRNYQTLIETDLILSPGKYVIDFTLSLEGDKSTVPSKRIGVLSVKDRGDVYLQLILPALISLVTFVLSIVASIITAKIVGRP